jgi:type IV pilus assembly protein PilC
MSLFQKHFYWQGIDKKGKYCQGKKLLKNKKELRMQLNKQCITPIQIKTRCFINLNTRIQSRHIIILIKQMSMLLSAGINLVDTINIIQQEQSHLELKASIKSMEQNIRSGMPLSQAIKPLSDRCNPLISNIIQAAEKTGQLAPLLQALSKQLLQQQKIKKKMLTALYYPITLLCVATLITGGLLLFVIPQFKTIYSNFDSKLPALTQTFIAISNAIHAYAGYFGLVLSIIGTTSFILYQKLPPLKYTIHALLLRLPLIKHIQINRDLYQWSQILTHCYTAGLPLINAIELANQTIKNQSIKSIFNTLPAQLEAGKHFSDSIKQIPFFNVSQQHLVSLGDQAGELTQVLQHISQQCSEQLHNTFTHLSKLIEPVIIIGIALMCGGCIIAMYLPIFNMGAII